MTDNPHTGSSFDDWLEEEGLLEVCTTEAIARIAARLQAHGTEEALQQLEAFLQPRLEEAVALIFHEYL